VAGTHQLIVHNGQGASRPYQLEVKQAQPGLLAPAQFKLGGRQYTAGVFADGATFALPDHPAKPGDVITLYGIGFGPVVPYLDAGHIANRQRTLALPLEVFIGGAQAPVTYAGLAPGTLGLYQFNVVVPHIPAGEAVPVRFLLGGVAGEQTLYTAIGQ
jgi:uncharacterized protein (TIGR03437 family)